MQRSAALRVASAVSLLLFGGHSAGGVNSWSPPGNNAVLNAMKSFHFPISGFIRSYWHFYVGFGWSISVSLFAQTVLLWQLASWINVDPVRARPVVALFFFASVASAALDCFFFFTAPLVMTVAIAACLGLALLPPRPKKNAVAPSS